MVDLISHYAIYKNPSDYPNHFVVRRWDINEFGTTPCADATLTSTLEEARAYIPDGYHRLPRMKNDDPAILEVWI